MDISPEELQFIAASLQQKVAGAEIENLRLQYRITTLEKELGELKSVLASKQE